MWGAIAGAAASVIGSLFGGSDDEEVTTTIDYGAMAKAAEKAGFNPLTAIRNGGSAGFTTTHHPGLSAMSRIGNAAQTLGNALMAFDERADERAYREQVLLRGQLDKVQRVGGASQRMWSMDVPTAQGATVSTKSATGGAASPLTTTYTDRYGRELVGPHIDAPDPETILTEPALRLTNTYEEWWRRAYGDKSQDSTSTWRRIRDNAVSSLPKSWNAPSTPYVPLWAVPAPSKPTRPYTFGGY